MPFALSSRIPVMQILGSMMLLTSVNLFSLVTILFSFCCSAFLFSITLSYNSLISSSASSNLLLIPSSIFFYFSNIEVFISDFFYICISLLKISLRSLTLLSIERPLSVFTMITLNYLPGILLCFLFDLTFLLCFYPFLSLGTYSSLSSFYLTLFLCIGKSATSPDLVKYWFMKKSCDALQHHAPVHQNHTLQLCLLCVLCAADCCCWAMFVFSPVAWNGPLCLLLVHWAGFGPSAVRGQSGAAVVLQ